MVAHSYRPPFVFEPSFPVLPRFAGKSGSYFGPWYGSSGMAVNVGNTMELEPSSDEAKNPKARSKLYELAAKIATEKLGSQLSNLPPQRAPPT